MEAAKPNPRSRPPAPSEGPEAAMASWFRQVTETEVTIPTGLIERVTERLRVAHPDYFQASALPEAEHVERSLSSGEMGRTDAPGRLSRRRWLGGLVGGGTVVAGAALGMWLWTDRRPKTAIELAAAAAGWSRRLEDGRVAIPFGPPEVFLPAAPVEPSLAVRPTLAARDGTLGQPWLGPVVVYRLGPEERPAWLFVGSARRSIAGLPEQARNQPLWSSEGFCAGAWVDGGLVSVVAQRGTIAQYRRLFIAQMMT